MVWPPNDETLRMVNDGLSSAKGMLEEARRKYHAGEPEAVHSLLEAVDELIEAIGVLVPPTTR